MNYSGVGKMGVPLFDGSNYSSWKSRMTKHLGALSIEIYDIVLNEGYTPPTKGVAWTDADKRAFETDARASNAILSALNEVEFSKVKNCKTAKEMWNKLENIYEGDSKVKEAKLQIYRSKFEQLRMNNEEFIEPYFNRVIEIVNCIRGYGEDMTDATVVKKILRSLPESYDAKVSSLEERDLNTLSLDTLQSVLIAYEMRRAAARMTSTSTSAKEVAFKAVSNANERGDSSSSQISAPNEEEANIKAYISRNFKKGTGKYKGKLPFKCFKCGKIGHYALDCPENIKDGSDDEKEDNHKKKKFQRYKKKGYSSKNVKALKNLLSKILEGSNSSSEGESDDESEDEEHIAFMASETQEDSAAEDEDAEVDMQGEIERCIVVVSQLEKEKKALKRDKDELINEEIGRAHV